MSSWKVGDMRPEIAYYLTNRGHSMADVLKLAGTQDAFRYRVYEIRQGKGKKRRQIEEPCPELKKIQQSLLELFERFPFHEACMARRGRSAVMNANVHRGAKHMLRVDIEKCYPNTTQSLICQSISDYVECLSAKSDMLQAVAFFCTYSGTVGGEKILPTGAPTSPLLCNIALTPLDHILAELAKSRGYRYTRYIDDIHLSTRKKKREWNLLIHVNQALKQFGYRINHDKSRWAMGNTNDGMNVTGAVLLGTKVPREFRRMLRAKLQNLAKEGKDIDAETRGCLAYVKSLDHEKFKQLLKYYERRRAYAPSNS